MNDREQEIAQEIAEWRLTNPIKPREVSENHTAESVDKKLLLHNIRELAKKTMQYRKGSDI